MFSNRDLRRLIVPLFLEQLLVILVGWQTLHSVFRGDYGCDSAVGISADGAVVWKSGKGCDGRLHDLLADFRLPGADMVEIKMEKPYSDEYRDSQNDLYNEAKPALSTKVENMAQYDVILLGYLNWWATMPRPVVSFVESYNLKGKTIFPFVSYGSGIFGESVSDLSKSFCKKWF